VRGGEREERGIGREKRIKETEVEIQMKIQKNKRK
jgi:hypothetical protein